MCVYMYVLSGYASVRMCSRRPGVSESVFDSGGLLGVSHTTN